MLDENCIFCKIIKGEIPSSKVYEDENMYIFKDIEPKAKIHYLMVLKNHFAKLEEMEDETANLLGECLKKVSLMQNELGIQDGYRLVINQGKNAGQTVNHIHIHILAGEELPF